MDTIGSAAVTMCMASLAFFPVLEHSTALRNVPKNNTTFGWKHTTVKHCGCTGRLPLDTRRQY